MAHYSSGPIIGPSLRSLTYIVIFESFADFADEGRGQYGIDAVGNSSFVKVTVPTRTPYGTEGVIRMLDKQDTIFTRNMFISKS
jgi:hypothetical protein